MRLNDLVPDFGSKKQKKRLGRGRSSGLGKTCCRGHKGQGARAGVALGSFEGGQNPLYTRLPKRGFVSVRSSCFQVVNFSSIFSIIQRLSLDAQDKNFVIDPDFLADKGLIRSSSRPVRLLSSGDVLYPLRFSLHSASVSSLKKIEASGGSFVQVPFTSL